MPKIPDTPDKFDEAVRALRKLTAVSDAEWEELTEQAREYAFKVARVAQADVAQDVLDAVERAVRDGTTLEQFREDVGQKLYDAWGEEDGSQVEMVFRSATQRAYSAGRDDVFTAPAILKARPYWRLTTAGDSRVSDEHDPLDGLVLPADHPWWRTHNPPFRPNCRCGKDALTEEEAREEGISTDPPDVETAAGFGRLASAPGEDWEPDPRDYHPGIRGGVRGL